MILLSLPFQARAPHFIDGIVEAVEAALDCFHAFLLVLQELLQLLWQYLVDNSEVRLRSHNGVRTVHTLVKRRFGAEEQLRVVRLRIAQLDVGDQSAVSPS